MTTVNFKLDIDADGIALLSWDVPDRSMNVITMEGIDELSRIVETLASDGAVKGVVITSAKDTFCAGADLALLESLSRSFAKLAAEQGEEAAALRLFEGSRKLSQLFRRIETCGKPWVAALNGTALGGGFELALACHYRVAGQNPKARLGLPEIKVGLFPGAGGTTRIARMLPPADALNFLLKGDHLSGRARPGHEGDRCGGAARGTRPSRQGLDQSGGFTHQSLGSRRLSPARRAGLFQGRHEYVSRRQRHLPARDF